MTTKEKKYSINFRNLSHEDMVKINVIMGFLLKNKYPIKPTRTDAVRYIIHRYYETVSGKKND